MCIRAYIDSNVWVLWAFVFLGYTVEDLRKSSQFPQIRASGRSVEIAKAERSITAESQVSSDKKFDQQIELKIVYL